MSELTEAQLAALAAIPGKWSHPPADMLATLPKPYKKESEKGKCSECGGFHGLPAVHLDYLGHADTTLVLCEIDPGWEWHPAAIDPATGGPVIVTKGRRSVMWINLTVHGKTLPGVGIVEGEKDELEKELIGDCLVSGTPIVSDRGVIPIEDVVVGDRVPTRFGWRHVTDHWSSAQAVPVQTVTLSDGRIITGTPHHRIPTVHRGVQTIGALRKGDALFQWLDTDDSTVLRKSSGTGEDIDATLTILNDTDAFTSWRQPLLVPTSIATSGRRPTARSLRGGTYTTRTAIRTTTPLTTLRALTIPLISACTEHRTTTLNDRVMSAVDGLCPRRLMPVGVRQLARNAVADARARPMCVLAPAPSEKRVPVSNAETHSSHARLGASTAPIVVGATRDGGRAVVWNLSVEDVHEYVANGVVVHNSLRNAALRFGIATSLWSKADRAAQVTDDEVSARRKRTSTARTGGEPPAQPPEMDDDAKARLHSLKDSRYSSAQLLTTARKIAAAEGHAQPTTIEALAVDESLVEATLAALDGRPVEKPQALAATGTTDAERSAPTPAPVRVMPNIVGALALLLAEMEPTDKAKLATWGKTQGIGNILKPTPEQAQLLYDHAIGEEEPF